MLQHCHKTKFPIVLSKDIPPQMKILNTVIPLLLSEASVSHLKMNILAPMFKGQYFCKSEASIVIYDKACSLEGHFINVTDTCNSLQAQ